MLLTESIALAIVIDMKYLILGAGPVGTTTADQLIAAGHDVVVATRSGGGPDGATKVRLDAADSPAVKAAAEGATAIVNAVNPPYEKWATAWPPIHSAVTAAARATGAAYLLMDNLYAFGPAHPATVTEPMREGDPLLATGAKGRTRAAIATQLLAATELRGAILRASDFFGPGVTDAAMGERVAPRVMARKAVSVLGDADAVHSWTYMPDVGAAMAALCLRPDLWGRAWHAPTAPPVSSRALVAAFAAAAKVPSPKVRALPRIVLGVGGLVVPVLRELRETAYQFERPFVVDSSAFTKATGIEPTPLAEAASGTIAWWDSRLRTRRGAT